MTLIIHFIIIFLVKKKTLKEKEIKKKMIEKEKDILKE